jgi:hypothetical protein
MRDPLENRELSFRSAEDDQSGDDGARVFDDTSFRVQLVRDRMNLLSFTTDARRGYTDDDLPFMRAWARARMWEQYANDHSGVCFAFDRDLVTNRLREYLSPRGMFGAREVTYLPRGFAQTSASRLDLVSFNPYDPEVVTRFVIDNQADLFFTKTLDWESEYEFRILYSPYKPRDDGYAEAPFGDASSVRAVILGERFPDWMFPAADWACKRVGVPLLRLQWVAGLPWPLPAG